MAEADQEPKLIGRAWISSGSSVGNLTRALLENQELPVEGDYIRTLLDGHGSTWFKCRIIRPLPIGKDQFEVQSVGTFKERKRTRVLYLQPRTRWSNLPEGEKTDPDVSSHPSDLVQLQDLPGDSDALLPHQVDIRTLGNPSDQENWRDGTNPLLASNHPLPSKPASECSILTQHPELKLPEEGELVLWGFLYGFEAIESLHRDE